MLVSELPHAIAVDSFLMPFYMFIGLVGEVDEGQGCGVDVVEIRDWRGVGGEVGGEKLEIMRVELGITTRAWRLK